METTSGNGVPVRTCALSLHFAVRALKFSLSGALNLRDSESLTIS